MNDDLQVQQSVYVAMKHTNYAKEEAKNNKDKGDKTQIRVSGS